jgi:glycine/D-amino acid oxidase-like deaminating enzyme
VRKPREHGYWPVRNDYRDPDYARLAVEARRLWREFERKSGRRLLVDCGRLDVDAGFADLAAVTQSLRDGLAARGVRVAENTEPPAITQADGTWAVHARQVRGGGSPGRSGAVSSSTA